MPEPSKRVQLLGPDGKPFPSSLTNEKKQGRRDPGTPLTPLLDPGTMPRSLYYRHGANLLARPRSWSGLVPFPQLRALGDTDLVRIVIEDVKGQIRGMDWQIEVRSEHKDEKEALQKEVDRVKRHIDHLDPLMDMDFDDCLGRFLEDILVLDALAVAPRFTRAGQPIGLEQVQGDTILPIIDARGRTPFPPAIAYEQIIEGVPETGYSMKDLWYLPRNRRSDSPYGRSPVENVILTVNMILRKQTHELAYYTEGTLPDSLYQVPKDWTPEDVRDFQTIWQSTLSGQAGLRSGGLRFVPGGEGSAYLPTKEHQWMYEGWEWLSRIIAWSFQVSPMPIAKVTNRATAEVMETSATESGIRPLAQFLQRVMNRFIRRVLLSETVEFKWGGDEVEDSKVVYERNVAYVGAKIMKPNEVRETIGLKPDEELDKPAPAPIMLPPGQVPTNDPGAPEDEEDDSTPPPSSGKGASEDDPKKKSSSQPSPPKAPNEQDEEDEEEEDKPAKKNLARRRQNDLSKWRRQAVRRVKLGKSAAGRIFGSEALPAMMTVSLTKSLRRINDVPGVMALFKGELAMGPELAEMEDDLVIVIFRWMLNQRAAFVRWAVQQLNKIEEPPQVNSFTLMRGVKIALSEAAQLGQEEAIAELGIVLDMPSADALLYAEERAAEMVGMRRMKDGSIVRNPNPKFAITETLRNDVQAKVVSALENGWSAQDLASEINGVFGESRARTIARTEMAQAHGKGANQVYKKAGIEHLEILDGSGCTPDGHDDEAAGASGALGVVEYESEANGQIWTTVQYEEHTIGHPNCVRAAVAFIRE